MCGTLVTEAAFLQRTCIVKLHFWCQIEIKLLELKFLCTEIGDLLTVRSKMLGDFTANKPSCSYTERWGWKL